MGRPQLVSDSVFCEETIDDRDIRDRYLWVAFLRRHAGIVKCGNKERCVLCCLHHIIMAVRCSPTLTSAVSGSEAGGDRKSVVSGKGVSVRVDLGGRHI